MIDALVLNLWSRVFAWRNREHGQTMAEYAVVLGIITVGVVLALGALGDSISAALNSVSDSI